MDTKVKIGVVITNDEGKVLLIKERLSKEEASLWNVIKGSHENGETVAESALRECLEEVGLEVKLISALGVYVSEQPDKIRVQFNFLAHAKNVEAKIARHEEQSERNETIEKARWFTKDEVANMKPNEFMSTRTRELLKDWTDGKSFPLEIYRGVVLD